MSFLFPFCRRHQATAVSTRYVSPEIGEQTPVDPLDQALILSKRIINQTPSCLALEVAVSEETTVEAVAEAVEEEAEEDAAGEEDAAAAGDLDIKEVVVLEETTVVEAVAGEVAEVVAGAEDRSLC